MTNASKSTLEQDTPSIDKASIKEAIGKLTGDVTIEAEGKSEKGESEKKKSETTSSKSGATSGSTHRS